MGKAPATYAPVIRAITTSEIKDEMWLEIGRYNAAAGPQRRLVQLVPPAAPPGKLPLSALLALDGAEFAEAAYRTVLDRAADDTGIAHIQRQRAAGISKIILLGQLQRSAEGRQIGRSLPGLGRRYAAQRLYRVPLLGWGFRAVAATLRGLGMSGRLGARERPNLRQLHTDLLARFDSTQAAADQRTRAQDAALEAVARRIEAIHTHQQDALEAQAATLADALRRVADREDAVQRAQATVASHGRTIAGLVSQGLATGRRLSGFEDSNIESLLAMTDSIDQIGARLARIEAMLHCEPVDTAPGASASTAAARQTLAERLGRAEAVVAQSQEAMIDQERRVGVLLEALRNRTEPLPEPLRLQDDRAIDGLYVDFEDRFRGTRADIKQRLRYYLPILAEAQAGSPERPVLDVGCGRGEFLELLRDEGFTARGVDANGSMSAACRGLGLDCVNADALTYLAAQPAGSLGAVTGFHIIEHLPFKTMVRLFDAALVALAPGGLLVFETPNPANLLVASRWFYLDPTHRNPLPGEMVAMIAEARGFTLVSIVELHPMEQRFGGADPVLREQLDALFHGPQDYALLARKP